jgi:hypothetical protein
MPVFISGILNRSMSCEMKDTLSGRQARFAPLSCPGTITSYTPLAVIVLSIFILNQALHFAIVKTVID